jgi:membrane protease YdiL (CAAX protease family)
LINVEQFAFVILPIFLVAIVFWIRSDTREYAAFKQMSATADRQRSFRKWILVSFGFFGIGAIVSLFLIGQGSALLQPLPEIASLVPEWSETESDQLPGDDSFGFMDGLGIGVGIVVGLFIAVMIASKKRKAGTEKIKIIGDIQPLFPRNNGERIHAAILSLNAGFSEELFFRLLVPILVFIVTGNAIIAVVFSILLFGVIHWYQGWAGVVGTTVMGTVFMAFYLYSGSIWLVMAMHAMIDLYGLLLVPALQSRNQQTQKNDDSPPG